jgi:hypothetical protein
MKAKLPDKGNGPKRAEIVSMGLSEMKKYILLLIINESYMWKKWSTKYYLLQIRFGAGQIVAAIGAQKIMG